MSIIGTLNTLSEAGDLVLYKPTVAPPQRGYRRTLWLAPHAFQWCCPATDHPDARITDESIVDLQSVLNAFVFNRDMMQGLDMRHLEPKDDEVWEFRSYIHNPRLRLFGSFALPSIFVAVDYRLRSELEPRRGKKWNYAIKYTKNEIRDIFGEYLPYTGRSFSDYLRGATYV